MLTLKELDKTKVADFENFQAVHSGMVLEGPPEVLDKIQKLDWKPVVTFGEEMAVAVAHCPECNQSHLLCKYFDDNGDFCFTFAEEDSDVLSSLLAVCDHLENEDEYYLSFGELFKQVWPEKFSGKVKRAFMNAHIAYNNEGIESPLLEESLAVIAKALHK